MNSAPLTSRRTRFTASTGEPTRLTGGSIVDGRYELNATAGGRRELTLERQTNMGNLLFIPGLTSPVAEIRQLLFGQGQPGGSWIPTLSSAMIAANSFGSGVTDILDLSGNNNPFSQATPASRGAWFREPKTGRRNLLTRTEQFDLSPWTSFTSGTGVAAVVTPNAAIAPDGTLTADAVTFDRGAGTTASDNSMRGIFGLPVISGPASGSLWAKAATPGDIGKILELRHAGGGAFGSITLTNDWVRFDRTETGTNTVFQIGIRGSVGADSVVSAHVWGFQLEAGSTPTAYQRVTTAFDVTEQGQRDCYGVRADGTDDGYATASIDFTGTNKVTVFAAVRKLSDATTGTIAELSANVGSNNGSFLLRGPQGASPNYLFTSKGTSVSDNTVTTFTSPVTNIITAQADISADVNIVRVNGAQVGSVLSDQGTGNYGNYPLYLFRRGGTTLPFNGNLYALIVAGGSYPLSTIQRVERLLSRITPTVNL